MFEGLRSSVLILSTHESLIPPDNFGQPSCPVPADVLVSIEQFRNVQRLLGGYRKGAL
jgi:hypothetical protein